MLFKKLQENWKSGLTVALVSIPLSTALAIASAATPTQGIITAFWACLFAAIWGGSNYNIIGPTGGLSGILIMYTIIYGSATLPVMAIISGFLILFAYLFRWDRYIIFIPGSVIHGFTLGIAFIIGLGQLENIFALQGIEKTSNLLHNTYIILSHHADFNYVTLAIFLLGLFIIFAWNKLVPFFPGTIVLASLGILLSYVLREFRAEGLGIVTLGDKYPTMNAEFFAFSWLNSLPSSLFNKDIWIISTVTAVVAILETLLSGQIADNMTKTKFDRSKELKGLGLANIASGICGGIPATAGLARTALNIKSGANHRSSAVMNSVFIFLIVFMVITYFKWLPMVVIASILAYVAISMVPKQHFIHLLQNEKISFGLSVLVAIITVAEDPIMGILIGSVIALLIFVNNIAKGQTEIEIWKNHSLKEIVLRGDFILEDNIDSDFVIYNITGTLTYVNMPVHLETVEKISSNRLVVLSLRHAFYADIDGLLYLEEIIDVLKKSNKKVVLAGVNKEVQKQIKHQKFYQKKLSEGKIYHNSADAIASLGTLF